jgi:hypothetical protein
LWAVALHQLVIGARRFGREYCFNLKGPASKRRPASTHLRGATSQKDGNHSSNGEKAQRYGLHSGKRDRC